MITGIFDQSMLFKHRILVQVRGQLERARSPYRVHGFLDFLRGEGIGVGYRIMSPRIGMDVQALDQLKPDFGVLRAPTSSRLEFWEGIIVEARSMGFDPAKLVVAGLGGGLGHLVDHLVAVELGLVEQVRERAGGRAAAEEAAPDRGVHQDRRHDRRRLTGRRRGPSP